MKYLVLAAFAAFVPVGASAATLVNGGFDDGLVGWTVDTTTFDRSQFLGDGATLRQDVAPFEVVEGILSDAARFQVGYRPGTQAMAGGIVLSQRFVATTDGSTAVSVDVATFNTDFNAQSGVFDLRIDGERIGLFVKNAARASETNRATISGVADLTRGASSLFELRILRSFIPDDDAFGATPLQFVDNAFVGEGAPLPPAVPLPASALLLLGGLGGLGALRARSGA